MQLSCSHSHDHVLIVNTCCGPSENLKSANFNFEAVLSNLPNVIPSICFQEGNFFYVLTVYTLGGRDFVAVSGSLNFLPLETRKNISIAIRDDGIIEEMEYFYVQLFVSGGLQTNVILGAANLSVVNIMDSGGSEPCEFVISSRGIA